MIEIILCDYLTSQLDFPVYMEKPQNPPEEYAVIERTDGGSANQIRDATFAVQTYAKSLYRAAYMQEEAEAAMAYAPSLHEICSVEVNSTYNNTNESTSAGRLKEYCYQGVYVVIFY